MPGPGKFKDISKKANKDVGLGSTESYKTTVKSKAANGTAIETSQEIKHAGSVVSKLSMKFKKCDGLRLDAFEAGTDGGVKAGVAFTNAQPGLDLSMNFSKNAKAGCRSELNFGLDYAHENLAVVNLAFSGFPGAGGEGAAGHRELSISALAGYEQFLLGGTAKLDFMSEKMVKDFGVSAGMNICDDGSRVTIEASKECKAFAFTGYFKPAAGVEIAALVSHKPGKAPAKKEGQEAEAPKADIDMSVAAKFSLDGNGTSLTTKVTTKPAMGEKFQVGLAYTQMLRSWAKLTASGEIGVTNVDHAAFGLELELGN